MAYHSTRAPPVRLYGGRRGAMAKICLTGAVVRGIGHPDSCAGHPVTCVRIFRSCKVKPREVKRK
eukprot:scaffold105744_cov69-Phaeocystis_antarctica.AAC.2